MDSTAVAALMGVVVGWLIGIAPFVIADRKKK